MFVFLLILYFYFMVFCLIFFISYRAEIIDCLPLVLKNYFITYGRYKKYVNILFIYISLCSCLFIIVFSSTYVIFWLGTSSIYIYFVVLVVILFLYIKYVYVVFLYLFFNFFFGMLSLFFFYIFCFYSILIF